MRKPLVLATSLAIMLNILVPVTHPMPTRAESAVSPPRVELGSVQQPSSASHSTSSATTQVHAPAELPASRSIPISLSKTDVNASTIPVSITESGFDPGVVTVTVGTIVEWTNNTSETAHLRSGQPHRIYLPTVLRNASGTGAPTAPSPAAATEVRQEEDWANVDIAPGASYTHIFGTAGRYPYFVSNHPDLNGLVVVTDSPAPDFMLGAWPATQTITRGLSISYTVAVTAINGFNQAVVLDVGGAPAGAAIAWAANPLMPTAETTLTITPSVSGPVGPAVSEASRVSVSVPPSTPPSIPPSAVSPCESESCEMTVSICPPS